MTLSEAIIMLEKLRKKYGSHQAIVFQCFSKEEYGDGYTDDEWEEICDTYNESPLPDEFGFQFAAMIQDMELGSYDDGEED